MNFWDGVLIASFFWFVACLACLLRGMSYGWNDFDIPRLNWMDGWDAGYKPGLDEGYDAGLQAAWRADADSRENSNTMMAAAEQFMHIDKPRMDGHEIRFSGFSPLPEAKEVAE